MSAIAVSEWLEKNCIKDINDVHIIIQHTMNNLAALRYVFSHKCEKSKEEDKRSMQIAWESIRLIATDGLREVVHGPSSNVVSPQSMILSKNFPRMDKNSSWLEVEFATSILIDSERPPTLTIEDIDSSYRNDPSILDLDETKYCLGHVVCMSKQPDMQVVRTIFGWKPGMAWYKDQDGCLPLHIAAKYSRSKELVNFLLSLNPQAISVVCGGFGHQAPLLLALSKNGDPREFVDALVSFDASVIKGLDVLNAMHVVVSSYNCSVEGCNYLYSLYPDLVKEVDSRGRTPLHCCRQADVAEFLLTMYPEAAMVKDNDGNLPAHCAARLGRLDTFKVIAAANPAAMFNNGSIGSTLYNAFRYGNADMVQFICERYPESTAVPNRFGAPILHTMICLFREDVNFFRMFNIVCKAYPRAIGAVDANGGTLLHLIFSCEFPVTETSSHLSNILRILLRDYPRALDVVNDDGDTPYAVCCSQSQPEYVKRILLRARPQLDMAEYRRLNYEHRRIALFVTFVAIFQREAKRPIICTLAAYQQDVIREILSFL